METDIGLFDTSMPDKATKLQRLAEFMFNDKGWTVVQDSTKDHPTLLESKQFPGYPLQHVRLSVMIDLPKDELVDLVWSATHQSMLVDEPGLTTFNIIESTPDCKIRQLIHDLTWPCWPRETVFVQEKKIENENETWLIGYSVKHPRVPLRDAEVVRTDVSMSVYKYTAFGPNRTKLQRVANVNPNGIIPIAIINGKAKEAAKSFNRWAGLGK